MTKITLGCHEIYGYVGRYKFVLDNEKLTTIKLYDERIQKRLLKIPADKKMSIKLVFNILQCQKPFKDIGHSFSIQIRIDSFSLSFSAL